MKEQVIDTDGQILTIQKIIEYVNSKGQYHRLGGPARIHPNEVIEYYVEGKLHRLDGPAVIWGNGLKFYYVDDVKFSEENYPKAVLNYKLKQLVG